jgi:hypothetical protein
VLLAVVVSIRAALRQGRSLWGFRFFVAGFAVMFGWSGRVIAYLALTGTMEAPAVLFGLLSIALGIAFPVRARRIWLRASRARTGAPPPHTD